MSESKKTHWKKNFDYNYLGSYSINENEERLLTIKAILKEKVLNPSTNKKEEKVVCYFEEEDKPMILNSTNHQRIQKLYDTPYIEDWIGKKIILIVESVRAFGENVDALRIKNEKPTLKDYSKCIEKLKQCKDLNELKDVYISFSNDERNHLVDLKDELKTKLS